jgi:hypothetical protein
LYRRYTWATFIGNSTAIRGVFERVLAQATTMLSRGAYIHWYYAAGLSPPLLDAVASISYLLDSRLLSRAVYRWFYHMKRSVAMKVKLHRLRRS